METGFYDATDGGALSVAVMGDYAYVANNVFFGIYDCSGALSMSERVPELMPRTVTLHSCYPNPFNPHTTISFDLPSASPVLLEVFNLTGQRVTILLDTRMTAGTHNLTFDGSHLASGAYFYSLTAGDYTATQKMLLIK